MSMIEAPLKTFQIEFGMITLVDYATQFARASGAASTRRPPIRVALPSAAPYLTGALPYLTGAAYVPTSGHL
jgi:hypothetical protein